MAEHDEAVGFAHRAEHARALLAGGAHAHHAIFQFEHAALILGTPRLLAQRFLGNGFEQRQLDICGAHHVQQCAAHKVIEGHHHRHRVAGQAKQVGCLAAVGNLAKCHRAARAHGDAPEHHVAQLLHHLLGEVGFAYRDTAGGDDRIGNRCGDTEGGFELLFRIRHHAHVDHLAPQALQHAVQGVAVRIVDFAFAQGLADGFEFVTGGEERHTKLARHPDLRDAERRDQPQLGRVDALAGAQGRAALLQILARQAAVGTGFLPGRNGDVLAIRLHQLHRNHGVAAVRHDRTGGDAHAFAWRDLAGEFAAGEGGADFIERHRLGGMQVGATHGPAVHGGVVMRRHVDRRNDVLSQNPAQGMANRHLFKAGHRLHKPPDDFIDLGGRQGVGIVPIDAADDRFKRGGCTGVDGLGWGDWHGCGKGRCSRGDRGIGASRGGRRGAIGLAAGGRFPLSRAGAENLVQYGVMRGCRPCATAAPLYQRRLKAALGLLGRRRPAGFVGFQFFRCVDVAEQGVVGEVDFSHAEGGIPLVDLAPATLHELRQMVVGGASHQREHRVRLAPGQCHGNLGALMGECIKQAFHQIEREKG